MERKAVKVEWVLLTGKVSDCNREERKWKSKIFVKKKKKKRENLLQVFSQPF